MSFRIENIRRWLGVIFCLALVFVPVNIMLAEVVPPASVLCELDPDSCNIPPTTKCNLAPSVQIIMPLNGSSVLLGDGETTYKMNITAEARAQCDSDYITSVTFFQKIGGVTTQLGSYNNADPTLTGYSDPWEGGVGTYYFTAVATDNQGRTQTSSENEFSVVVGSIPPPYYAPIISIINPNPGDITLDANNNTVSIVAKAFDQGDLDVNEKLLPGAGVIKKMSIKACKNECLPTAVELKSNTSGPVTTDFANTGIFREGIKGDVELYSSEATWKPTMSGVYEIVARATDANGNYNEDSIFVKIQSDVNPTSNPADTLNYGIGNYSN